MKLRYYLFGNGSLNHILAIINGLKCGHWRSQDCRGRALLNVHYISQGMITALDERSECKGERKKVRSEQ